MKVWIAFPAPVKEKWLVVDLACPEGSCWEKLRRAEAAEHPLGEDFEVAVSEVAAGENLRILLVWPFDVLPGRVPLALSHRSPIPYDVVPVVRTICPQNFSHKTAGSRVGQYKLPARLAYGCLLPTSRADGIEL